MLFFTWSRLTLYFSVLLCWISSSIGHVFIYTPSLLIIRLEFTKKYLVNVFTFENLLFSACFRSLWIAFVCSLLLSVKLQCLHFYDVSKKPSLLCLFPFFFVKLRSFVNHIFVYALSSFACFPRIYEKILRKYLYFHTVTLEFFSRFRLFFFLSSRAFSVIS